MVGKSKNKDYAINFIFKNCDHNQKAFTINKRTDVNDYFDSKLLQYVNLTKICRIDNFLFISFPPNNMSNLWPAGQYLVLLAITLNAEEVDPPDCAHEKCSIIGNCVFLI